MLEDRHKSGRIEVLLDPRQVLFLAVGTTVVCGILFSTGFFLGRRSVPVQPAAMMPWQRADEPGAQGAQESPKAAAPQAVGEVEFLFPGTLNQGAPPPQSKRALAPAAPMRAQAAPERPAPERAAQEKIAAQRAAQEKAAQEKAAQEKAAQRAAKEKAAQEKLAAQRAAQEKAAQRPAKAPAVAAAPRGLSWDGEDEAELEERSQMRRSAARTAPAPAAPSPPPAAPPPAAPPPAKSAPGLDLSPVAPKRAAKAQPEPKKGGYTVQLKAVKSQGEVDTFLGELRAKGVSAHVVVATLPGKGQVFRIRTGRFNSRAQARSFQEKLEKHNGLEDSGFITEL